MYHHTSILWGGVILAGYGRGGYPRHLKSQKTGSLGLYCWEFILILGMGIVVICPHRISIVPSCMMLHMGILLDHGTMGIFQR